MNVIGLMSGTSADGIDAAMVAFDGDGFRLVAFRQDPYPPELRKRILAVSSRGASRLEEVARLNFLWASVSRRPPSIGRRALIGSSDWEPRQTILHLPEPVMEDSRHPGDASGRRTPVIAERTGVTTVADFRPRDIAAGGQGTPSRPTFTTSSFAIQRRRRRRERADRT
jgi:anhydro-N-acetylmuramic acid kinase